MRSKRQGNPITIFGRRGETSKTCPSSMSQHNNGGNHLFSAEAFPSSPTWGQLPIYWLSKGWTASVVSLCSSQWPLRRVCCIVICMHYKVGQLMLFISAVCLHNTKTERQHECLKDVRVVVGGRCAERKNPGKSAFPTIHTAIASWPVSWHLRNRHNYVKPCAEQETQLMLETPSRLSCYIMVTFPWHSVRWCPCKIWWFYIIPFSSYLTVLLHYRQKQACTHDMTS